MSDDFDREAEREKLREQFGEDEADREHSERLSELLLKGATMTNKHCNRCSDPIFRHDGREFCPTCQREVADGETSQATAGQAATEGLDAAGNADATGGNAADGATDGAADADGQGGVEVDVETPDRDPTGGATDPTARRPPAESSGGETDSSGAETPATDAPTRQPPEPSGQGAGRAADAGGSGGPSRMPAAATDAGTADGLMPARQHLTRTVNRLAEQAAAEEDPGRKREFLAATREAAEALAAVRDAE